MTFVFLWSPCIPAHMCHCSNHPPPQTRRQHRRQHGAPPSSRPTTSSCSLPALRRLPVTLTPQAPPPTPHTGTSHLRRRLEGSFLRPSVCVIKFPPVVSVLLASSEGTRHSDPDSVGSREPLRSQDAGGIRKPFRVTFPSQDGGVFCGDRRAAFATTRDVSSRYTSLSNFGLYVGHTTLFPIQPVSGFM